MLIGVPIFSQVAATASNVEHNVKSISPPAQISSTQSSKKADIVMAGLFLQLSRLLSVWIKPHLTMKHITVLIWHEYVKRCETLLNVYNDVYRLKSNTIKVIYTLTKESCQLLIRSDACIIG